jgi:O-antigen/teichoic acid export membrane protein
MLQLRMVLVTDVDNLHQFEDYFGLRLATNIIAFVIIVGILVVIRRQYDFSVFVVILLLGLSKVIQSTSDVTYGLMQKHERLDRVAQSGIIKSIGALILFAIIIKSTGNLILGVASTALCWLLVLFSFDKYNIKRFGRFVPRFHHKAMVSIMWIGLPLGIVMGLIALNGNMSRYFIEAYLGSESLGYFGAIAYVVIGAHRASAALAQSAVARLARYYVSNRKAYVRLLGKLVGIALLLSLALFLFGLFAGKSFLSIVYTPEYAKQHDVFVWLIVASGGSIVASMLGAGMTSARRFKSQVPVLCLTMLVCLLCSWLLIPTYGLMGAAWVKLAMTIIRCLGSGVVIILALRTPSTLNGVDHISKS